MRVDESWRVLSILCYFCILHFRAYIEFERPQNSYFPIIPAVYLALKMRFSVFILFDYYYRLFLSLTRREHSLKHRGCFHRYLQMPLTLYIAEDGQKRMIEKTAKRVATKKSTSLRTDRWYHFFIVLFPVNSILDWSNNLAAVFDVGG